MMQPFTPDKLVTDDDWSDLSRRFPLPDINFQRLHQYRRQRIKAQLREADAACCLLVNPISLRYAVDYRTYALFQSHIPTTYLLLPQEGPVVLCAAYGSAPGVDRVAPGRALSFFDGGNQLPETANALAADLIDYLSELGTDNRRIAVEYVNPTITLALQRAGLEVIDGVAIAEQARVIKSPDEITCMKWAIKVAEHGIDQLRKAIRPGVTELQLWALLNYTNLANNGDWHEGRMLASGARINPWLQEASAKAVESGDLVGFDTDMVGPYGYFADISRTMHCGPQAPTKRQRELYQLAVAEIEHNLKLVKPGVTLKAFQKNAWPIPEQFQQNAYTCLCHAVGMCDEYPRINPIHRGETPYDDTILPGMVLCIESYIGAVGEKDGVKLEQQVLVTDDGYELLSRYPLDDALMQ
jgi:Xaa-Pro aminopeptidase